MSGHDYNFYIFSLSDKAGAEMSLFCLYCGKSKTVNTNDTEKTHL